MAKFYNELDSKLCDFIKAQHLFFVASAPHEGCVNVSPKGMDTFRILDNSRVAYLDVTGSGNETAAHLKQNGRMTIMFCSFDKQPLILRLYGQGRSIRPGQGQWDQLMQYFKSQPGQRQIIVMDLDAVQTSCGYGVPLFDFAGERETLQRWALNKGDQGIKDYWREKNLESIDGLPSGILD